MLAQLVLHAPVKNVIVNPFPTGMFLTNQPTGGGDVCHPQCIFLQAHLNFFVYFLLTHRGPEVYLEKSRSLRGSVLLKYPKIKIYLKLVTKRPPPPQWE